MTQVDNITSQANQLTQVLLEDGTVLQIELVYRPTTQRWTMNLTHPQLTVSGINLCVHPNILREWRNVITFGLACDTTDGIDPLNIDDFVNGRASLYALNEADVLAVEENVFGGVLQ